jgi:hypothetical protein
MSAGDEAKKPPRGSRPDGGEVPPHHDPACWGCGDNPTGIHLPTPEAEGLTEYESYLAFDERHQAAPGLVHGGSSPRPWTRHAGCSPPGTASRP